MSGRGPAPRLSATEALLSCAAAETAVEMLAARMALIENAGGALAAPDTRLLLAGDGTAGRHLLGENPPRPALPGRTPPPPDSPWTRFARDSCALRSSRLQTRLLGQLARPTSEESS